MIVTCPSCKTRFHLDTSVLGYDGRRVRCHKCQHVWFQEPENEAPQMQKREVFAAVLEQVEIDPIPDSVRPDHYGVIDAGPRKPRFDVRAAFAAFIRKLASLTLKDIGAAAAGFAAALVAAAIVSALFWPAAKPDMTALTFENVKMEYAGTAAEPVFDISGMVVNTSKATHSVPLVDVAVLGPTGAVQGTIEVKAGEEVVAPEKASPFSGSFKGWPEKGSSVRLQFAVQP